MSDSKNIKARQVVTAHPSSLKHSNTNSVENLSLWSKLVNIWPVTISTILTIAWLTFCGFIASNGYIDITGLSIIELSSLFSAVFIPLIMLWLICIALMRTNPLSGNQHSLTKGLDQLLGPVDIAQNRVSNIVKNLQTEIKNIEDAADLASGRFKNLENNFQEQISELFRATENADDKSTALKDKLATERDAITLLATEIEKHTDKISNQIKLYKQDVLSVQESVTKQSETLDNEMNFQNKTLNSRAIEIEDTLESMAIRLGKITEGISDQTNHSYHNLNDVIDGFDERKAVLNNFMTSMMDEVGSICEKMDSQAHTLNTLTTKTSADSEKITATLKDQAIELSNITQKAISDVAASGKVIEDQTKSMGLSISEATEHSKINIAKASDFFTEKANDLNRVSNGLETDIKQNFSKIETLISDKAISIGQNITIKFQTIEDELDRSNVTIHEMLIGNIEKLKSLIDQNKDGTKDYLTEITSSIKDQSDNIDKSLSDMRINMIDKTSIIESEYQSLENYANNFQEKMIKTEKEIKKQQTNMLSCISVIEDGLSIAVEKINKNSLNLGVHGQKVIETIISQTNELTKQISEVQSRGKNSLNDIQNARKKANDNILANEKETSHIINQWLKSAQEVDEKYEKSMKQVETLVEKLTSLENIAANSAIESEENIKRLSNQLLQSSDRIHLASTSAIEAVEETNKSLDQNSDKYQQMINAIQLSSQSLLINADAIEHRLNNKNKENFSNLSASIMEKLHSESIDISKYLDEEMPQELWESYISGDKSIFVRKIKKYLSNQPIMAIRNHYKIDAEFRKHVDSFIQIFEELLNTFTKSTEQVYSETLISSDIGKVYFALAEVTGRLKS